MDELKPTPLSPAGSPGGSVSPAHAGLRPSAPVPTTATAAAAATISAAFAEARRATAACECATARLLLGSTALLVSCDVLTRSIEIRSVAAGVTALFAFSLVLHS
jgi:hypothetical protein